MLKYCPKCNDNVPYRKEIFFNNSCKTETITCKKCNATISIDSQKIPYKEIKNN